MCHMSCVVKTRQGPVDNRAPNDKNGSPKQWCRDKVCKVINNQERRKPHTNITVSGSQEGQIERPRAEQAVTRQHLAAKSA